jgi:hypothetical protein
VGWFHVTLVETIMRFRVLWRFVLFFLPVCYVTICSDGWLQAIRRTHFPSSSGYFEIHIITQKTTVRDSSFMKTQSLIYYIDFLTSWTNVTLRSSVVYPQLPTRVDMCYFPKMQGKGSQYCLDPCVYIIEYFFWSHCEVCWQRWVYCFVDRASWYIRTIRTNRMHYLLLIYFNN